MTSPTPTPMLTSTAGDNPNFTTTDVDALLSFWFDGYDLSSGAPADPSLVRRWFLRTPEFARSCGIFTPLLTLLSTTFTPSTIATLATTPRRALALTILLTQIPRLLFPASPIHSVYDPLSLAVATHALSPAHRYDLEWKRSAAVRMWFLLPGGNSRDLDVLEQTLRRAEELVHDAGEIVDGVWDGAKVAEARNLLRFLEGRRDEVKAAEGEGEGEGVAL